MPRALLRTPCPAFNLQPEISGLYILEADHAQELAKAAPSILKRHSSGLLAWRTFITGATIGGSPRCKARTKQSFAEAAIAIAETHGVCGAGFAALQQVSRYQ